MYSHVTLRKDVPQKNPKSQITLHSGFKPLEGEKNPQVPNRAIVEVHCKFQVKFVN